MTLKEEAYAIIDKLPEKVIEDVVKTLVSIHDNLNAQKQTFSINSK